MHPNIGVNSYFIAKNNPVKALISPLQGYQIR
jgi:hypothetical protein